MNPWQTLKYFLSKCAYQVVRQEMDEHRIFSETPMVNYATQDDAEWRIARLTYRDDGEYKAWEERPAYRIRIVMIPFWARFDGPGRSWWD